MAKSLEDPTDKIRKGLVRHKLDAEIKNLTVNTLVKGGAGGMGEISEYNEINKTRLPSKAYRYVFCILKCSVSFGDQGYIVFEESEPNSVRSNKPLLQSICDENDTASLIVCLAPIEKERNLLKDSINVCKRPEIHFQIC